ncbi:Cof-type HAD-IIB family hydrolase [Fusobacterium varium]|uniref:Cof-type HAD-IIB family hydrolase n=1 Tax=Fusobacterium varium TaxID=856 RepID=UPI000BBA48D6|nr:Cof-type HAD-IIB family hydrolase [uncultured Fusobacterium sp.]BBA52437.1 putative haloacid dehalogenase [Fusobacterium varium]
MKLVVSDLDGTLLDTKSQITDYTKAAVKKLVDNGIEFAIATGRGRASAVRLKKDIGLDIYLICNNGANIYDKKENSIFEKIIDKKTSQEIIKLLRDRKIAYNGFIDDDFYRDEYDKTDYSRRIDFIEHILVDIEDCPALHKIIIVENTDIILKINKELREKFSDAVEITISDPECIDIVPKECSKGNALKVIAQQLGIDMKRIMAFGDGENDLDMLRKVGHPVAMENAQEIVKKEINNTAPKNIENGVALYLEKFFKL